MGVLGLKQSKKTVEKRKQSPCEHHLYLRRQSETLQLTRRGHQRLHHKAYDYIYYKYGKRGIDEYIKYMQEHNLLDMATSINFNKYKIREKLRVSNPHSYTTRLGEFLLHVTISRRIKGGDIK